MWGATEMQRNCTFDETNDKIKAVVISTDIHITSVSWVQMWQYTVSAVVVGREVWVVNVDKKKWILMRIVCRFSQKGSGLLESLSDETKS